MTDSIFYALLEQSYFFPLYDKLKSTVENKKNEEQTAQSKQALLKNLSAEQEKLLRQYVFDLELQADCLRYEFAVHALNLGVQIGIELHNAFIDWDKI